MGSALPLPPDARARLQPLIAEYLHGVEGTYDVLRDVFLEHGLVPLPRDGTPADRLEAAYARLAMVDQMRLAAASVRRLAPEVTDARVRAHVLEALDAVGAAPELAAPEGLRKVLFLSWQSAERTVGARVVWAAWMLLRALPGAALRTTRAISAGELDVQISETAAAIAE